MRKIPTLFLRGKDGNITRDRALETHWCEEAAVQAKEKLDGTNVRLTIRAGKVLRVEKRRNPTKKQKQEGILDPWYIDASPTDPQDKWIMSAVETTITREWPDGEHSCEAIGPNIQGNPLCLENPRCVPFNLDSPLGPNSYLLESLDFDYLIEFFHSLNSLTVFGRPAEGIVWHHPDGRRAKLKVRDFRQAGFFDE